MREWLLTPLIGAVIGYMTNWLAIKMLFRPYTEKRLFGLRLPFTPGLIPKERRELAKKLGETLSGKVLTEEVLAEAIGKSDLSAKLEVLINEWLAKAAVCEKTVNELLGEAPGEALLKLEGPASAAAGKLSAYVRELDERQPGLDAALRRMTVMVAREQFGGLVGMFINYERVYDNLKNSLCAYLDNPENDIAAKAGEAASRYITVDLGESRVMDLYAKLPEAAVTQLKAALSKAAVPAIEKAGAFAARSLNVSQAVEDKLNSFAIDEAEAIILSVVNRELRLITLLGGVLGFVIGFAPAMINLFAR